MAEYEEKEQNGIEDESEKDDAVSLFRYDITSFGADYDVEGIVNRLRRGDIFIPTFQRQYIWTLADASRFIESLLLGLPVPGIFLAREAEGNKLIVIDGQQRLKSLQFFYDGFFNSGLPDAKKQVFNLVNVQKIFEGKSYESLDEKDRVVLNDSIIHATIIKQENPKDDNSSVYHVFERLNTGGRKLEAQEIRSTIYQGNFLNKIELLNNNAWWRKIFGKPHPRLKDREMILRFLAFYYLREKYKQPMKDFLNTFLASYRNPCEDFLRECERLFDKCMEIIIAAIGSKAFRIEEKSPINAAFFDSVMVGLAERLKSDLSVDHTKLKDAYTALLDDVHYISLISNSTASERSVSGRMSKTTEAFQFI